MSDPDVSLTPSVAGKHHPTRAVHDRPREGEHFEAGVLHSEGRALGEHWSPYYVVEFTDFFCAHCQEAHKRVTGPLLKDWAGARAVHASVHRSIHRSVHLVHWSIHSRPTVIRRRLISSTLFQKAPLTAQCPTDLKCVPGAL